MVPSNQIREATQDDGAFKTLVTDLTRSEYKATGLKPGVHYMFRVFAGSSGVYETVGETMMACPLPNVSALHVGDVDATWADL